MVMTMSRVVEGTVEGHADTHINTASITLSPQLAQLVLFAPAL